MRKARFFLFLVIGILFATAVYFTLRSFGYLETTDLTSVKSVPSGHQEIAWIAPATSGDTWGRIVAAVRYVEKEWAGLFPDGPSLHVSYDNAFLDLAAEIPEIVLYVEGCSETRLWIRWYKLSSELSAEECIQQLLLRSPPPLAVIGGENSDRALRIAQALRAESRLAEKESRSGWPQAAPLFLITTATADRYHQGAPRFSNPVPFEERPKLLDVYKNRTFRFSFTNTHMANTVLEFVAKHPRVWFAQNHKASSAAAGIAMGDPFAATAVWMQRGLLQPVHLHTLAWGDNRYSLDLAEGFARVFPDHFAIPKDHLFLDDPYIVNSFVQFSVGDYYQPNPKEANVVHVMFARSGLASWKRRLLVLPTATRNARRFLRSLSRTSPAAMRNLVVLSGDSISFNNLYRDRDVAWNIQDVPVPLIFFAHRNPISKKAGFRADGTEPGCTTGTQDLLLFADIIQPVVQAAFLNGELVTDADRFREHLRQARWYQGSVVIPAFAETEAKGRLLFDGDGDRRFHTGEHVVWLQPIIRDGQTLPKAMLSVWHVAADGDSDFEWRRSGKTLPVFYNRGN